MRVLTDVAAIDREFDYEVPAAWHSDGRAARLAVGTMVRVVLAGRRVGGWVTACDPEPEAAAGASVAEAPGDPEHAAAEVTPAGVTSAAEVEESMRLRGGSPVGEPDELEPSLALVFAEGEQGPPDPAAGGRGPAAVAEPPAGPRLRPLAKLVGAGPAAEVLDLARWAAWRWAGRRATFFGTASPPRVVEAPAAGGMSAASAPARTAAGSAYAAPTPTAAIAGEAATSYRGAAPGSAGIEAALPPPRPTPPSPRCEASGSAGAEAGVWDSAFDSAVSVVRIPPAGDRGPLLAAAMRRGDVLFVTPHTAEAVRLARWARRAGATAALLPEEWAQAAAGGAVVGTRAAVFGPCPRPAAVVVLDEHDEALAAEDSPTWSVREVAVERARRAGVPCLLVSPVPTLEAQLLAGAEPTGAPRAVEREGWPTVEVVDQRDPEVSRHGLLTEVLTARLRACDRAVCVLNRRGRARLLACAGCGELVVCDTCGAAAGEETAPGDAERVELACRSCGARRPRLCSRCGATRLRTLRPGVAKLRADLQTLLGEPVAELSGTAGGAGSDEAEAVAKARVVVGTEAALHRVTEADLVAFLDFDQELSAPRYRANEQAMALLARAARLVGPRSGGGRMVVQTRRVDHPVVQAARQADPGLLSRHDREQRRRLGLPPFAALAEIAGAAAPAFVERLGHPPGLEVSPVGESRWIVRAGDHATLLHALAATERPPGRLRLAVDPLRI